MDYFPIPPNAEHIKVPYLCREPYIYDGGSDWEGYPERKGWTQRDLFAYNNHGGRKWRDVESFFQSWLYFGTIHAFFGMLGMQTNDEEFVVHESTGPTEYKRTQSWVTSKPLTQKIAAWKKMFAAYKGSKAWRNSKFHDDTKKILDTTINYCRLWGEIKLPDSPNDSTIEVFTADPIIRGGCPVRREVLMSIMGLCHVLRTLTVEIYAADSRNVSLTSILLQRKLEETGWCKADTARLFREFGLGVHYYVALSKCPYGRKKHALCDARSCRAANVDDRTYITRHADGCPKTDQLEAYKVDELVKQVVGVIDADGIPVVCWDDKHEVLRVQDASVDGIKYTAISHVWADGLGNPRENALPKCELSKIQKLVDKLGMLDGTAEAEAESPRFFWMDTLCIPVAAEFKDRRKKSIAKMGHIYRSSSSVLVLDRWVQTLPADSSIHEKCMRIFLCNWLHRLWTLQEAMLAGKLYIQFDGSAELADDLRLRSDQLREVSEESGDYSHFPSAVFASALGFLGLKEQISTTLEDEQDDELARNCTRFVAVARAMGQRSTSRSSDETLCVASAMGGLNVSQLLAVHGDSETDTTETRMELFLKQIRAVPAGIIFHHNPRLTHPGFRWAPRTMMGGRSGDFFRDWERGPVPFDEDGIRVSYPGIILGPLKRKPPGPSLVAVTFNMTYTMCFRADFTYIEEEDKQPSPINWDTVNYLAIIIQNFSRNIVSDLRSGAVGDAIFGAVENADLQVDTTPQSGQTPIRIPGAIKVLCAGRCAMKGIATLGGQDPTTYTMGRNLVDKQEWVVR